MNDSAWPALTYGTPPVWPDPPKGVVRQYCGYAEGEGRSYRAWFDSMWFKWDHKTGQLVEREDR